jgi:hypothetical protein
MNAPLSGAIWFAMVVGVVTAIAVVRGRRAAGRSRGLDVGSVSDRWVAEHRADSSHGVDR